METLAEPKETKATKEHKCSFCSLPILKGEVYIKSTHKYDGNVYDWKAHGHCNELVYKLNMYDYCDEGVTEEDFRESIHCEYQNLMVKMLSRKGLTEHGDILQELRRVNFRDKLAYVIRYYRKIDKTKEDK